MPSAEKKAKWREKRKKMRQLARKLQAEVTFQQQCGVNDPTLAAVAKRIAR